MKTKVSFTGHDRLSCQGDEISYSSYVMKPVSARLLVSMVFLTIWSISALDITSPCSRRVAATIEVKSAALIFPSASKSYILKPTEEAYWEIINAQHLQPGRQRYLTFQLFFAGGFMRNQRETWNIFGERYTVIVIIIKHAKYSVQKRRVAKEHCCLKPANKA